MTIEKQSVKNFWFLSPENTATELGTDLEKGISQEEAVLRLEKFGQNTIDSSKKTTWLRILLNQLKSPLIMVLIMAGIVTLFIAHYKDTVFIFIAVVVNSILGFYQENKAERALSELKTYIKQRARVIRGGKEREIPAEEIVPGDIIRLAQGDRVPADARVIFVNDFQVDEAVLTGESLPVGKSISSVPENAPLTDQKSMVFAGTLVTQGVCAAIVCRTGRSTELGKIAELIADSNDEKTPLQRAIIRFSVHLSIILGSLTFVVFIIGIIAREPALDMFLTAVAIAVAAIPEGLPISMTVILAIGVQRMAKRKGVVRKLVAAEALGSTTLILTDKTGTLTMAKMVLSKIIPVGGIVGDDAERLNQENRLLGRALANTEVLIENPEDTPDVWRMNGRIMEKALVQSAAIRGTSVAEIMDRRHIIQTMPFNAVQKFSAALTKGRFHGSADHSISFLGAPDILIKHSVLGEKEKRELLDQVHNLALSGERVLGVASKGVDDTKDFSFTKTNHLAGLTFEGFITFHDPVRSGIKGVIERIKKAGIRTIIMTGDHRGTAMSVAQEIGMDTGPESVLDASEIVEMPEDELRKRLPKLSVISRVTPFDKLRIVKLFQESGEIVAMTGDGVNDAPSIRQADVGVAMGSGTEVSQSVADLVLLDDNFETIVAAIEEGRQILGNIRKVLVYLLSNVTDGLILIGGSLIMGLPLPLNALQILWVNFFSGSFPAIAFAFEKDTDALAHRPMKGKLLLFNSLMKFLIVFIGISTSALLFVCYVVLLKMGYDIDIIHTFIFAAFGTYILVLALSVRSLDRSILSYPLLSNRYMTGGILIGFVLMAIAIYVPAMQSLFGTVSLPAVWVAGVFAIGLVNILLIETTKKLFRLNS